MRHLDPLSFRPRLLPLHLALLNLGAEELVASLKSPLIQENTLRRSLAPEFHHYRGFHEENPSLD